jgi:hypothetical protein
MPSRPQHMSLSRALLDVPQHFRKRVGRRADLPGVQERRSLRDTAYVPRRRRDRRAHRLGRLRVAVTGHRAPWGAISALADRLVPGKGRPLDGLDLPPKLPPDCMG